MTQESVGDGVVTRWWWAPVVVLSTALAGRLLLTVESALGYAVRSGLTLQLFVLPLVGALVWAVLIATARPRSRFERVRGARSPDAR